MKQCFEEPLTKPYLSDLLKTPENQRRVGLWCYGVVSVVCEEHDTGSSNILSTFHEVWGAVTSDRMHLAEEEKAALGAVLDVSLTDPGSMSETYFDAGRQAAIEHVRQSTMAPAIDFIRIFDGGPANDLDFSRKLISAKRWANRRLEFRRRGLPILLLIFFAALLPYCIYVTNR